MSQGKEPTDSGELARLVAEAKRVRREREKGYRERALKLFPPICGRCGREFSGRQLRELTVHHRDHNHDNNPPDGSNWELLCIYCHENEHSRYLDAEWSQGTDPEEASRDSLTHKPFAQLEALLKGKR